MGIKSCSLSTALAYDTTFAWLVEEMSTGLSLRGLFDKQANFPFLKSKPNLSVINAAWKGC